MTGWVSDLVSVCFPAHCIACNDVLLREEQYICLHCRIDLPQTNFSDPDNLIERRFWGRVRIDRATSMFYYKKQSKVQNLIHKMKYGQDEKVGIYLGKMLGGQLINWEGLSSSQCMIPVPIHRSKMKKRGFNQSMALATGISQVTGMPVEDVLVRKVPGASQTGKSRIERWNNVMSQFDINKDIQWVPKNVLLIDDVITTGATLEACARLLVKHRSDKINVATLACSMKQ